MVTDETVLQEKVREVVVSCRKNLESLQSTAERMRSELTQLITTIDRVFAGRVAPEIVFPWCEKVDELYDELCEASIRVEDDLEDAR